MSMRYDSEHRRALDTMKGDRQKEVEKLKAEAAASLASLQTITQKLDKVSARKSILEQEVMLFLLLHQALRLSSLVLLLAQQACFTLTCPSLSVVLAYMKSLTNFIAHQLHAVVWVHQYC